MLLRRLGRRGAGSTCGVCCRQWRRALAVAPAATHASASPSTAGSISLAQDHSVPAVEPEWGQAATAQLPFYSQFPLDRRDGLRRNAAVLSEMLSSPAAKLVPLHNDKVLVTSVPSSSSTSSTASDAPAPPPAAPAEPPSPPRLVPALLTPASAAVALHAAPGSAPIFLGVDAEEEPYFAVHVADPVAVLKSLEAAAPAAEGQAPEGSSSNGSNGGGAPPAAAAARGPRWLSARVAGAEMAPHDAALLAVASGLGQWHAAHAYHPSTGSATQSHAGGHARKCSATGASLYPRIDPAVIMLVTAGAPHAPPPRPAGAPPAPAHMAGEWCLLGRKAEWPRQRYSTLAGFLEVGEPLELAVAREVREESGVRVDLATVAYAASQPWPFPRSLMVGFYAAAAAPAAHQPPLDTRTTAAPQGGVWVPPVGATGYDLLPYEGRRAAMDVGLLQGEVEKVLLPHLPPLEVDRQELEDCRWFHRDWLRARVLSPHGAHLPWAGDFNIPGPWSLANRLIMGWLQHDDGSAGEGAWAGDLIPQVAIDEGVFKYVLLRLSDPETGRRKLLVWGDARAAWHMDIYQRVKSLAYKHRLQVEPLGGGRIEHHSTQAVISIYGYSGAFGPAPHEVAAALLRKWLPLYDPSCITTSYEGY